MEELRKLVGKEWELDEVCERLHGAAGRLHAPVVGAHAIRCSDETEKESMDAFQRRFVDPLLPNLKLASRSSFRTASLGSRYEWGSARIAEHHYATSASARSFKLMVVKVTSHVYRESRPSAVAYGRMSRYDASSDACGALHALVAGRRLPAIDELREAFGWRGVPRLAARLVAGCVAPALRALAPAVANVRLQARAAALDICDYEPATPTHWVICAGVTINAPGLDTEVVVGLYTAVPGEGTMEYYGLGDDPRSYIIEHRHGRLLLGEREPFAARRVTDHRARALAAWEERAVDRGSPASELGAARRALEKAHGDEEVARAARAALEALCRARPEEAAVRLFAGGVAPIDTCYRADRVARGAGDAAEARAILDAVGRSLVAGDAERVREALLGLM